MLVVLAQPVMLLRIWCCTDSKAACWGALACHRRCAIFHYWPDNSQQHDAFHITVQALVPEDAPNAPQHPLHPQATQALVLQDLSMLLPATVSTELDPQVPVVSILSGGAAVSPTSTSCPPAPAVPLGPQPQPPPPPAAVPVALAAAAHHPPHPAQLQPAAAPPAPVTLAVPAGLCTPPGGVQDQDLVLPSSSQPPPRLRLWRWRCLLASGLCLILHWRQLMWSMWWPRPQRQAMP